VKYKHLFFDLDHTLWDFEGNASLSLDDVYHEFDLRRFGIISAEQFKQTYFPINDRMWAQYRRGELTSAEIKIERFRETLKKFSVLDHDLVAEIKEFYLKSLPLKGRLMPGATQVLDKLQGKAALHIVSNGFLAITKEKIKYSGIQKYFDVVLSAEEVGVLKPNQKVFEEAFRRANASASESIYIGDSLEADVRGPRNVGMDQIYYNVHSKPHDESPTHEVNHLLDIAEILL